jgi:glycosidase
MDVINFISKDHRFFDASIKAPHEKYQLASEYFANGPRLHEYLRNMRNEVLDKYDTVTVGEMPLVDDDDEIIRFVKEDGGPLNMIFVFDFVYIDQIPGESKWTLHPWDARDIKRITNRFQRLMIERHGWNAIYYENHDNPRAVSHYADDSDEFREFGAKLICMNQITLSGTLYVYQGQELGMRNIPESWGAEEYKGFESLSYWNM